MFYNIRKEKNFFVYKKNFMDLCKGDFEIKKIVDCTAVVLCGGKSLRMGFDKSLLQLDGEYVLLKTVACLQEIFSEIVLITDCKGKFPEAFQSISIIEDNYCEEGPLGGLVTSLETVTSCWVFLLACDMPNISLELILEMARFINESYEIVVCKQGNRLHPLFAFYHKKCLSVLKQQLLLTNNRRMIEEFKQFSVKVIKMDQRIHFVNINIPKELEQWRS